MPTSTDWILKYVQQCYVKWFWTTSSLGAPERLNGLWCHGWLVHFVDDVYLIYSASSFAYQLMELEELLNCDWQNYSFVSSKYVYQTLFQTFQTTKMDFEKLFGVNTAVFNNHNFTDSFHSSSLTIRASFCICCYLYLF